ncbi:MAG: head GIN domain-containing protein [Prolixibacteraceae bacterium]
MKNSSIGSLIVLLGILLATLLSSCTASMKKATSDDLEKDFEIEDFNQINFEGAYNIELTQGDGPALMIKTTDELMDKIQVSVSDSTLNIKTNVKNISSDEIRIFINFNRLNEIVLRGGAFLKTNGFVELTNFDIKIEGGASVEMNVNAEKISARAEGAVNLEFHGVVEEFSAISEGAGNIDADELQAKIVDCRVSGVGNASVYATEKLTARVEGLGKIGYRGDPVLDKKVDGIGLIYKK